MPANDKLPSYMRDAYLADATAKQKATEADGEEASSCRAFGYLRGLQERALAVRFCFRSGSSVCLPYSWLGPWEHNPSAGLLLKFTGDTVLLVIIHGSNLDGLVGGASVNLTDRGLQRHRILWVQEMDEDELQQAEEGEPTIDRIDVAAFDSQEKMREWISQIAPAFVEGPLVAYDSRF